jgi:hypothetical protein
LGGTWKYIGVYSKGSVESKTAFREAYPRIEKTLDKYAKEKYYKIGKRAQKNNSRAYGIIGGDYDDLIH